MCNCVNFFQFQRPSDQQEDDQDDDKFKFTDLNVDCAFLILQQLDFDNLLNVAQVNQHLSALAAAIFRRKYSHLQVQVQNNFKHPDIDKPHIWVAGLKIDTNTVAEALEFFGIIDKNRTQEKHDRKPFYRSYVDNINLQLLSYDTILNTFKHFGHLITKLKFDYRHYSQNPAFLAKFMGDLISNYSVESLIEIEFHGVRNETMEFITVPLNNVQEATFKDKFYGSSRILPLNELFPYLRRLTCDFTYGGSLDYFHVHVPHLEHVLFRTGVNDVLNSPTAVDFEKMLIKNSQIRSVHLYHTYSEEYLHTVHENLPQLETLTLSKCYTSNQRVEFENVTTFAADLLNESPQNLHFPRLQVSKKCIKIWRDFG